MMKLNLRETKFVTQLFDESRQVNELHYTADNLPLLVVSSLHGTVQAKRGKGILFRMVTVIDANKDKYAYQMEFLIFDERELSGKKNNIDIYPVAFKDFVNHLTDSGCLIEDDIFIRYFRAKQKSIAQYAGIWVRELEDSDYEEKRR